MVSFFNDIPPRYGIKKTKTIPSRRKNMPTAPTMTAIFLPGHGRAHKCFGNKPQVPSIEPEPVILAVENVCLPELTTQ